MMRHVSDEERRARLGARHGLGAGAGFNSVAAATRALTVLHATEPSTVYLSLQARVPTAGVPEIDAAMYDDRSVVKQLAMRRTLFGFPPDLLPAALGSASARVAVQQRALTVRMVEQSGVAADGAAWLERAAAALLDRLADGSALSAKRLREEVPELGGQVDVAQGTKYAATVSLAPRVLTVLGAEGLVFRAGNEGHWRTSRPSWTLAETWLGGRVDPLEAAAGYAELVRRWLASFGPGTETDLVWWLGATKTAVRRALADLGAVAVSLDNGSTGWLLPEDLDPPEASDGRWVALLPTLDATVMGWKERDFYLDPALVGDLFDRNGNAGTTAWVDGRVVGAWVQDAGGRVGLRLVADVDPAARRLLDAEAERLTDWLGGQVISTVYKSRLMTG